MNPDLPTRIENLSTTLRILNQRSKLLKSNRETPKRRRRYIKMELRRIARKTANLKSELKQLRWQYDQQMLSKTVRGETSGPEYSRWWMNRY